MPVQFSNEKPPKARPKKMMQKVYQGFTGCDFAHDAYLCRDDKSPELLNMIGEEGVLVGRKGWEPIHQGTGAVHCLAYGYMNGTSMLFAHIGTKLYRFDNGFTEIYSGLPNSRSQMFFSLRVETPLIPPEIPLVPKTLGFILTGAGYYYLDIVGSTVTVAPVTSIATIPVVKIGVKPNGAGATLDAVNLLQPKRSEKFLGDGTTKTYQLGAKGLDATTLSIVGITATGQVTYTEGGTGATSFTVDRTIGTVTFNTAPPVPPVTGEENIYITYAKTRPGYADRINKCRAFAQFGLGGALRVFVTRNPEYRSYDWWSDVQDPAYFPDLNYGIAGSDNTAIMGYLKFYDKLAIVKEDNNQDTTIYFRSGFFENEKTVFVTQPGIQGSGAVSPYAFASLGDEPVFFSKTGVYSILSNAINQQAVPQNRSYWVDERLQKEPNLQNALAVAHDGKYFLSLNGHTYIISAPKNDKKSFQTEEAYSCYYWEGFNPVCYLSHDDVLYFGTSDGKICRFKNSGNATDYFDGPDVDGQRIAIPLLFTTKQDDDEAGVRLKTMVKKGSFITLKPYFRSTVNVYYRTNMGEVNPNKPTTKNPDLFDFGNIDFQRFSFLDVPYVQPTPLRDKVKKYKTLQFVCACNEIGETFGLVAIGKQFVVTSKYARG